MAQDAPERDEPETPPDAAETTDAAEGETAEVEFPPPDLTAPQLTIRAILTGMVLGGILSLCNVYAGLKIGWGFNMSITAMLLGFGLFKALEKGAGTRSFGLLENNINQTTASSAASISSAGLVAPIPALTMITGEELSYPVLVVWTFAVSLVGVVVAIGLRRQMLLVDKLPFPGGIASAETIKQMYAKGAEAMARVKMLLAGAAAGAGTKLAAHFLKLHPVGLPGSIAAKAGGASGVSKYTMMNLGFALDPSVLMIGVGAIIGLRAGISLLLGAVIAWGWIAPMAMDAGWAHAVADRPDAMWFGALNKWMLWPGVAMMVTASLTSFAFSWKSVVAALRGAKAGAEDEKAGTDAHEVPKKIFLAGLFVALVLASITQISFFSIPAWIAISGVLLTFVLAIVAARVSGETGITPVGPMGKVTQLLFGVLSPGNVAGNLMAANVTGGAASQCADLLHDMKTGALIGASPRFQAFAQSFGVLAGALVGCAGYLVLVPDPAGMLLTDEWPAPAVAAWKAVAELFREGLEAMPEMAPQAMAIAGGIGVVLAVLEKLLPKKAAVWVPSPASMGLALVVPALYSLSMFLGAILGFGAMKASPSWAKRFLIVLAAGLIAGESLVGVVLAIWKTVTGS
ncbi:MAG: peptide transporter [Sandaracinus sp.]|nr:peptide transporter [Sandaracinus sp.]MBJ74727.1 peptide transporter [Sandaracinus sp.]